MSMERSCRELSNDMVIHRGILKNNEITLSPCFAFILKTGVSFYSGGAVTFHFPIFLKTFWTPKLRYTGRPRAPVHPFFLENGWT